MIVYKGHICFVIFSLLLPFAVSPLFVFICLSLQRASQSAADDGIRGPEATKAFQTPANHTHMHTVHFLPHSSAHSCRGSPESPMCLFCICQQKQVCRCPLFRSRRTCSAFKYLTQGSRMLLCTLDANERITVTGWDCVGLATLCLTLW